MKKTTTLFFAFVAALILTAGCVGTVTGGKTTGVPFIKDRLEGRYKMPPEPIFNAAKAVIRENGVLTDEGIKYNATNQVRVVQGRVNENTVWVSIAPVDSQVTSVAVQTRTVNGGSDMDLAHQIEKEIAIKLMAK